MVLRYSYGMAPVPFTDFSDHETMPTHFRLIYAFTTADGEDFNLYDVVETDEYESLYPHMWDDFMDMIVGESERHSMVQDSTRFGKIMLEFVAICNPENRCAAAA